MSRRKLRILVGLGLLAALVAGGLGLYKVVRTGQKSRDPLENGLEAELAGNPGMAERLYRRLLATKPDHPGAFAALLRVLSVQNKHDEMAEAAAARCEGAPHLADGWIARVDIALRQGRFRDAVEFAAQRVQEDPELLQATRWRVLDVSDDPRRRIMAVDAALRVAELTKSAATRATAELFAVATLLELADGLGEEKGAGLRAQAQKLRADGAARLSIEMQTEPRTIYQLLLHRFALLDQWEAGRHDAAKELADWINAHGDLPVAVDLRRDLAMYHLREARAAPAAADAEDPELSRERHLERAREFSKPLADDPPYQLLRLIRAFTRAEAPREALEVLEARQSSGQDTLIDVMRCRLQLQANPADADTVVPRVLACMAEAKDWRVALLAYETASRAGQPAEALAALQAYQAEHDDAEILVAVAQEIAQDESSGPEVLQFMQENIGEIEQQGLLGPLMRLLIKAGPEHVMAFLEARLSAADSEEYRYRVLRAWYVAALRGKGTPLPGDAGDALRLARADLRRCFELDLGALPELWAFLVRVAAALDDGEAAGMAAARSVRESEDRLARSIWMFQVVGAWEDDAQRGAFRDSLRQQLEGTEDRVWCEALAAATVARTTSPTQLLDALVAATPIAEAAARALDVIAALAARVERYDLAEQAARRLVEADPKHVVGTVVLAQCLMRSRRHAEFLELVDGMNVPVEEQAEPIHRWAIDALLRLGRGEDARQRAEAYYRTHPQSSEACLALARLHLTEKQPDRALAVLSAAPQTVEVQLLRAGLLLDLKQLQAAERICWAVCRRAPRSAAAWGLLLKILGSQERAEEIIVPLSAVLDDESVNARKSLSASLLVIRGEAQERANRTAAAIADYRRAVQFGSANVGAMNNAAWLIVQTDRAKLAEAKRLIEMALALDDVSPAVNDTAAHVYLALGEHDRALECIRRALAGTEKNWSYRLTLIRILDAKGDRPAARAEIERALGEDPTLDFQQKTSELVRRWDAEDAATPD